MHRNQAGAVKLAVLLLALVAVSMAAWVLVTKAMPPAIEQPIAFNHQKHLSFGLSCDTCHQHYEHYPVAGLPATEICMTCHAASLTDSPEEAKVRSHAERGKEIPWVQVHRIADHSYFSHRRHVIMGKLDCALCHGDMTQVATPLTRPAVALTMDWCVGCHTQRQVSNDCNTCHK